MSKTKNACTLGDRVDNTDLKGTTGIVIDLDIIENEGGLEPRAKVYWNADTSINQIYLHKQTWICEGNLTLNKEDLIHRNH